MISHLYFTWKQDVLTYAINRSKKKLFCAACEYLVNLPHPTTDPWVDG